MKALKTLKVNLIDPTRHNPRRIRPDDPAIKELAESIKANGLLQPVLCRPVGKRFELLAGERRFVAHQMLGETEIMAIVADLDDDAALDATITENMQREDLTPLEEARGVASLLAWRGVDDVAARLGKSQGWVRRRARLATLSPAWMEVLEGDLPENEDKREDALSFRRDVSVAVLEIAAALPIETQDGVLRQLRGSSRTESIRSAAVFQRHVAYFMRDLAEAPWDLDSTENGQACAACTARSDFEPDLFSESATNEAGARCLDAGCFARKRDAFMATAREAAEKKHGKLPLLGDGYGAGEKVDLRSWQVRQAKKSEPGAVPVFALDGTEAGKVVYVIPRAPREEEREEPKSIRVIRLEHMIESFNAWLEAQKACPPALAHNSPRMLVALKHYNASSYSGSSAIETADDFDRMAESTTEEFWDDLWEVLRQDMGVNSWGTQDDNADHRERELDLALHVCGLEKQDFVDAAVKAHPGQEQKAGKKRKA